MFQSVLANNYLLLRQNAKAEKAILLAIKTLQNQKNKTLELSNCYKNLSEIYYQKKDYKLSEVYFETALRYTSETFGLGEYAEAKNFYEYAVLLHKMNDDYKSKEFISRALNNLIADFRDENTGLPMQNQLFADNLLLDVLDLKAEIYSLENNPKKALETYKLCDYIEDLFSNLLVYENSKIINQIRVYNRTEKCIAIYNQLFLKEKNQNYLEQAFLVSEKTKSGVLRNYLSENKTFTDDEIKLRQQIQNINNEIVKEQQKINYADLDKINYLISNQNKVMLALKSIQKTNPKTIDKTINLNQLFKKLNADNASLIEYFVGQNTIYTFVLNDNKIKLNTIENSEINKNKILKFIDFFATPNAITDDISGYLNSGNRVYKMLQIPQTSYKNLIIIPDGLLNFVPFEALITKNSSTTNFAKINYLMKNFVVSYNNSAAFYLDSKPLSNKNTVLGIFPIFEQTDYELTFSKSEMQAIQKKFDGKYLKNKDANFQNFKTNANQYSILHLSTHADAGDIESPATIKFYDQDILYSELYNLKINPNLVVLSACQTGIGKLYKSEGAMSVARGFQAAGAQNLLFSLWKVNDFTTSIFMTDFYKNIKKTQSFATANHQSKLDFLENKTIPNAKKSPYYWSAFVYYGTLEKSANNYWIWNLGGLVLVLCGWFLRWWLIKKKERFTQ